MKPPAQLLCHELYDYFLDNLHRLHDVLFMTEFLKLHCHFKPAGLRGSHLRCLQVPSEFANYLVHVGKLGVRRYLEVGVASGGSWFITDSYLRALMPSYEGSTGYDIANNLVCFDKYQERFPDTVFRQQSSELIDLGNECYDLALIDARHQEEWVRIDFDRVKDNCRHVAFHDIALPGRRMTVDRFWKSIKPEYKHHEFVSRMPVTCGIGLLDL